MLRGEEQPLGDGGFRRQQLKDAASTIRQYLHRHATRSHQRQGALQGDRQEQGRETKADILSSSTNAACVGAYRSSPRGQLNLLLDESWQRPQSRNELESLDDAMLRDIGLSHREAGFDASKPFWAN